MTGSSSSSGRTGACRPRATEEEEDETRERDRGAATVRMAGEGKEQRRRGKAQIQAGEKRLTRVEKSRAQGVAEGERRQRLRHHDVAERSGMDGPVEVELARHARSIGSAGHGEGGHPLRGRDAEREHRREKSADEQPSERTAAPSRQTAPASSSAADSAPSTTMSPEPARICSPPTIPRATAQRVVGRRRKAWEASSTHGSQAAPAK